MITAIEIHHHGRWHRVGDLAPLSDEDIARGHRGNAHFVYDDDYAITCLGAKDYRAVCVRYPVDLGVHRTSTWPAFILDILPTGATRRALVSVMGIRDDDGADWQLLNEGAGHPPGNLRIRPTVPEDDTPDHPGFTKEQVAERDPAFIEYAYHHRAGVAGTSGAHGESPKFLLTEDANGVLHADGALPDSEATFHWLVKWPRGSRQSDRAVLRNEAAYLQVASKMGVRVHSDPVFLSDTLFVNRFDRRVIRGRVERFGLESLCSLAGVAEYGAQIPQERLAAALARASTEPDEDLTEFVLRDILNVALGNTDNHARNSAVLKTLDGQIRLAPLYDFAPMFLDESGIPRASRWTAAERMGLPDWPRVVEIVEALPYPVKGLRAAVRRMAEALERAPDLLRDNGADEALIERLSRRISDVRRNVADIRQRRKSQR